MRACYVIRLALQDVQPIEVAHELHALSLKKKKRKNQGTKSRMNCMRSA